MRVNVAVIRICPSVTLPARDLSRDSAGALGIDFLNAGQVFEQRLKMDWHATGRRERWEMAREQRVNL